MGTRRGLVGMAANEQKAFANLVLSLSNMVLANIKSPKSVDRDAVVATLKAKLYPSLPDPEFGSMVERVIGVLSSGVGENWSITQLEEYLNTDGETLGFASYQAKLFLRVWHRQQDKIQRVVEESAVWKLAARHIVARRPPGRVKVRPQPVGQLVHCRAPHLERKQGCCCTPGRRRKGCCCCRARIRPSRASCHWRHTRRRHL